MKKNKTQRFIMTEYEGSSFTEQGILQVIVDKETGVNYLWMKSGYAGGMTPLLDADGKPIITKLYLDDEE